MDAQQRAAQLRARTPDDILSETLSFYLFDQSTVFMMANQIALLQLGRLTAACVPHALGASCPNRNLELLESVTDRPAPLNQMTRYVAFNDVNDLLGFELPPYLPDTGLFGQLVNVSVRNPGFSVPFLFKSPSAAHTHQAGNSAIIEAIVEGFDFPRIPPKK